MQIYCLKVDDYLDFVKKKYNEYELINHKVDYYRAICAYNGGNVKESLDILLTIYKNTFPNLIIEYYSDLEFKIISKIVTIYNELDEHTKALKFFKILNEQLFRTINETTQKLSDHERYYFLNNIYDVLLNVYDLLESYSKQTPKYTKVMFSFRLLLKLIEKYEDIGILPDTNFVSIHSNAVIIDIIRVKRKIEVEYFAFIVKKSVKIIKLNNAIEKENEFYEYYIKSLRRKSVDLRSYKNYWEEMDAHLKNVDNLYLTCEGYYNHINIGNLYTAQNKYYYETKNVYLFQNYFGAVGKVSKNKKEAVIIGNPAFELKNTRRYLKPPQYIEPKLVSNLSPLPFSETEGRIIGDILRNSDYHYN